MPSARVVAIALPLATGAARATPASPHPGPGGDPVRDAAWWMLDRPEDEELRVLSSERPRITLDVGGHAREQYEAYRNFEFGLESRSRGWDDYHLHRLLVHADLRFENRARVFVEFGNSLMTGNDRPVTPVDEDPAYIHQAFGELALGDADGSESSFIRVGRQEMPFGSGRLFSLRDGPNIRLSFDAARLRLASQRVTVDAFVGAQARIRPDAFDNRPDDAALTWGLYTTTRDVAPGVNLDAYYLGVERERAVFDAGVAPATRHSLGTRIWGRAGRVDFNFEPVLQLGRFGGRDIMAWTIATDTGVRLGDDERAPRLGLRADVISGGHSGSTLRTFDALFPNNSYFSEAAIFAPANLIDLNPTLTVHPTEDISITAMWDFLWRYDTGDAIYVPPGVPAIDGDASRARFVGHSVSIAAQWRLRERLTLFAAFTRFEAGSAVSGPGGSDIDYVLFGLDLTF